MTAGQSYFQSWGKLNSNLSSLLFGFLCRAGRNNENEVHPEKPLCNIEFKDCIIESPCCAPGIACSSSSFSKFQEKDHCLVVKFPKKAVNVPHSGQSWWRLGFGLNL